MWSQWSKDGDLIEGGIRIRSSLFFGMRSGIQPQETGIKACLMKVRKIVSV